MINDTLGGNRVARVSVGAVFGATAALMLGVLVVLVAPSNDIADLAATAATRAVLPLGAVVGALLGHRSRQHRW
jgi:hypothetical protein